MTSGRPDWFGTIVAAGKYDSTFIPIALDVDGFITATMKGAYDAVLKTIAVDSNGIMKANLSVQDLNFLTVRPAYGESIGINGTDIIDVESYETIVPISGKGVIIGGWVTWGVGLTQKAVQIGIKTEGTVVEEEPATTLNAQGHTIPGCQPLYLSVYDDVAFTYTVGISKGLTFETSFDLYVHNPYEFQITVVWRLFYALVP